jgi:hypothetical protein
MVGLCNEKAACFCDTGKNLIDTLVIYMDFRLLGVEYTVRSLGSVWLPAASVYVKRCSQSLA